MYERYYGFRERPFQLTPDPQYLFLARQHRGGLAMFEYSLTQRTPLSMITGEIGCGKTTLIRYLLNKLGQEVTVGLISNTTRTLGRLLQWVSISFGLEHRGMDDAELYDNFVRFLLDEYAAGRQTVLIVDEAQNLNLQLLEELRVLCNINSDKDVVLQTILVGQPELNDMVRTPGMEQLAQRIGVDYHLSPLAPLDCRLYVWHRLRVAGGRTSTFRKEAIDMAGETSGGVPRLINQLCDAALVHGFVERQKHIEAELMEQVIGERTKSGVFPRLVVDAPAMSEAGQHFK